MSNGFACLLVLVGLLISAAAGIFLRGLSNVAVDVSYDQSVNTGNYVASGILVIGIALFFYGAVNVSRSSRIH